MPTYDYRCKECGYTFEELHSMTAEPLVSCPKCGKPALQKLLATGAGMIFKGSGFYQTDYKKGGGNGESKPETKKGPEKPPDSPPSKSETAT